MGIVTPLNEGFTERFCREDAFQEEEEEQETAPPQEAASGSGGPNPNPQIPQETPQETPLGKHRRKGDESDPKVEMETEPEGRDLGKEAEEEAAAAAAHNAASCAAAANEAARIAAEANKSIAAAQNLAREALQAAQIPTPATPNPTQASEAPDPVRILRELFLGPPGTVPPRSLTPIETLEARGESLPDNIHPAWMEWESLKDSNEKSKQRLQSFRGEG